MKDTASFSVLRGEDERYPLLKTEDIFSHFIRLESKSTQILDSYLNYRNDWHDTSNFAKLNPNQTAAIHTISHLHHSAQSGCIVAAFSSANAPFVEYEYKLYLRTDDHRGNLPVEDIAVSSVGIRIGREEGTTASHEFRVRDIATRLDEILGDASDKEPAADASSIRAFLMRILDRICKNGSSISYFRVGYDAGEVRVCLRLLPDARFWTTDMLGLGYDSDSRELSDSLISIHLTEKDVMGYSEMLSNILIAHEAWVNVEFRSIQLLGKVVERLAMHMSLGNSGGSLKNCLSYFHFFPDSGNFLAGLSTSDLKEFRFTGSISTNDMIAESRYRLRLRNSDNIRTNALRKLYVLDCWNSGNVRNSIKSGKIEELWFDDRDRDSIADARFSNLWVASGNPALLRNQRPITTWSGELLRQLSFFAESMLTFHRDFQSIQNNGRCGTLAVKCALYGSKVDDDSGSDLKIPHLIG